MKVNELETSLSVDWNLCRKVLYMYAITTDLYYASIITLTVMMYMTSPVITLSSHLGLIIMDDVCDDYWLGNELM